MYIGPKTLRGTNKNTIRVPDLLTKVFLKALAAWQGQRWQESWERDKFSMHSAYPVAY
jgi:hypothetical protein